MATLLVVRLYFVQIVHGDEYRKDALGQYMQVASDLEDRGVIYFTSRDRALVAAAVMQSGSKIAIRPSDIKDVDATYQTLNEITPIDRERFFASAAKKEDPYEEVASRVSEDATKKIREKKIEGVLLVRDQWRTYPAGELAAQTLGFVGFRGDVRTGMYGLERAWQDTLVKKSSGLYVNPFAEIFANVGALLSTDPGAHQGNIVTYIEPSVQLELEKTLDLVMKTYTPKTAGGIIMDPKTGAIVAMAGRPGFDPNTFNLAKDPSVFSNPLIEGRYELGSIMKPLTMVIGIDSGAVTPRTTYNDTGCMTRSTRKICNYDFKARGVVPMQEILNQSLNLGVTFVTERVGFAPFTAYMKALGLNTKTGIDVPNEVNGDLSPLGEGKEADVNYAAASFGQGISVTPIEMTRALATLANEGTLPSPRVVSAVRYDSGISRSVAASSSVQVFKPESARTVTDMLVTVYDDALLGGELKREHYSIAAKTGTAQMAQPGGGYYSDRYLHSFFGYFPAYEPRFIVFLFAVEPHGAEFASASLARPFSLLSDFLINYYDIPPDR